MILRRLGNKKKIAKEIQKYFPPHKIYIEPFFGAGGLFFQKPKSPYNIVNDLDSDVFNLFMVVMNQKEELEKAFYMMPIHSDLLEYWKKNKETDPIKKAIRFLMLSNMGYMGKPHTLAYGATNDKDMVLNFLDDTLKYLYGVQLNNDDFRKFLPSTTKRLINKGRINDILIYCDPPYVNTEEYENKWEEIDSLDLFDCLEATGCKFAMSEFDNPFILEQAKKRGLNVHIIGERQNLKNRRIEILVTNYQKQQYDLF